MSPGSRRVAATTATGKKPLTSTLRCSVKSTGYRQGVRAARSVVRVTYKGAAMQLRLGTLSLLATAGLLAGCGSAFESQRVFDEANSSATPADTYHQTLRSGYLEHATYEQEEMMNYTSAMSHARNAELAARGETPAVAGITDFGPQPADKVDELTQARDQLASALGDNGAAAGAGSCRPRSDLLRLLGRAAARELPAEGHRVLPRRLLQEHEDPQRRGDSGGSGSCLAARRTRSSTSASPSFEGRVQA